MTPLHEVSAKKVASAWEGGAKYRIDADLVLQNLFDSELFHRAASAWEDGGFVAIKRSAAGLYDGPDPKCAHLALFGGEPTRLLNHAREVLRAEGYESLVVGTDSGHFLPGVPVDLPQLERWLLEQGFIAGGLAYDLERDLTDYVLPRPLPPEPTFRRLDDADQDSLQAFLRREFPERWHYDVARKVDAEGIDTVFGLFVGDPCEGFALLQQQGCRLPIGGATWRSDLGDRWGSLGPIGISRSVRGRGWGDALLGAALCSLRDAGARRTIIDWTNLVGFYGAHGFSVTRSYRSYRLSLQEGRPSSGLPRL